MADEKKKGDKPKFPKPATLKAPKPKDGKDLLKKGADAVKDFDEAPEVKTKLKGQIAPELDSGIEQVVKGRAKFMAAFRQGLSTYVNAHVDECDVVNTPMEQFSEGLAKVVYQAFGKAKGLTDSSVEALIAGKGSGEASVLRYAFRGITGLDMQQFAEELKDKDQVDYAAIQQSIIKPVSEHSLKHIVEENIGSLLPQLREDAGTEKLKKLADIVGLELKPKDLLIPEQRVKVYQQALIAALENYSTEYLPKYGKKA